MKSSRHREKIGLGYLMELATGHYRSKVLFVATNLKIFTLLSKNSMTLDEITDELNIETRPASMLLNACVALKLLEKKDGLYSNSPTAELYLVEGNPKYMEPAFFKFDEHSYLLFDKLEEAIVSNSKQIPTENPEDPELLASCMQIGNTHDYRYFLSAMDPIAEWPASVIATTFDFSPFRRLIDVGGGTGVYSVAIVRKWPNIEAVIVDLPYVCEIGEKIIKENGLSHRIRYHSADFLKDGFPEGFDLVFLSNILHGYGPEKCDILLRKIYDTLPHDGGIIISDLILDEDGCGPEVATLLSLYFLLITTDGRNYTAPEYENMLKNAGFGDIKLFKSSAETKYITGIKR